MKIGIYHIVQKRTGRTYYGQSVDIDHRLSTHRYHLYYGNHYNRALQEAYAADGDDGFVFEMVQECVKEELDREEAKFIECFDNDKLFNVVGCNGFHREECRRLAADMRHSRFDRIDPKWIERLRKMADPKSAGGE